MKAVLLEGFGGREMLQVGRTAKPVPAPGQVRIKVKATSVNRADIVQRQGHYPPPAGDSDILGLEVAGVVDQIGAGNTPWKIGDRVMSLVGGGGYAEYALAPAEHLIPIPENMSFEQAACICEVFITAYLNIFILGGFEAGQSVLIHGGSGGVGTAAIQLCRTLSPDATIAATTSPAKMAAVEQLGADWVINYHEGDFAERIRSLTDRKGVNLILDHVGAKYLAPNLKCLAREGRLVVIGVIGGAQAEINLAHLMVKRQQIIGSTLRSRSVAQKSEIIARFRRNVLPKIADGTLVPQMDRVLPLEQTAQAHQIMEEGGHFGKIVLRVDE